MDENAVGKEEAGQATRVSLKILDGTIMVMSPKRKLGKYPLCRILPIDNVGVIRVWKL